MTAISAIIDKKNNVTYLASDQMGSNGFTGQSYKTPKLIKKKTMSLAFCGSYRIGQVLCHNFHPRRFIEGETVDDYVYNYLDTEFRSLFEKKKCLKEESGVACIKNGSVIFAVKDRIFSLQGDLAILEPESIFLTDGSGMYHQEASIYTQLSMNPTKSYKRILEDSIIYTSDIVLSVGGKPQILKHNH